MEDNQQHAQSESETEFMVPNLSLCDPLLEHFEQSCVWLDVSQVPSILAAVDCRTVGVKIVIWDTSKFYGTKINEVSLLQNQVLYWVERYAEQYDFVKIKHHYMVCIDKVRSQILLLTPGCAWITLGMSRTVPSMS